MTQTYDGSGLMFEISTDWFFFNSKTEFVSNVQKNIVFNLLGVSKDTKSVFEMKKNILNVTIGTVGFYRLKTRKDEKQRKSSFRLGLQK